MTDCNNCRFFKDGLLHWCVNTKHGLCGEWEPAASQTAAALFRKQEIEAREAEALEQQWIDEANNF